MTSRPNVLIFMSDQHNSSYLGCAGHPLVRTPNIDRLAAGGIRFASAYCASPLCGPSRMSFLTGLYPVHSGVYANAQPLPSDLPTFAHAFGAAGYHTALIGRMHLNGPDQHHGFEEKLGGDVTASTLGGGLFPLTEGLPCGSQAESLRLSGPGDSAYHHYDDEVAALAAAWLVKQTPDRPFMATVGFALPHNPFVCRPDDYAPYAGRMPVPPAEPETLHPFLRRKQAQATAGMGADEFSRSLAAYAGSVTATDRRVGLVLAALERTGLAGNTIVVYTADHGEAAGEHGLWHKCTMLEGSVRVPLVIHFPDGRAGGAVCNKNVNLLDLGPTLLDLAGAGPLPDADGRSFRLLLEDPAAPWDNATFSEYGTRWGNTALMRMLRRDRWKYIYYGDGLPSLFDLEADPGENNDLAASPAHAGILAKLQAEAFADWSPAEVNRHLDLWNRRNAMIYKWFASRPRPAPTGWTRFQPGSPRNPLNGRQTLPVIKTRFYERIPPWTLCASATGWNCLLMMQWPKASPAAAATNCTSPWRGRRRWSPANPGRAA